MVSPALAVGSPAGDGVPSSGPVFLLEGEAWDLERRSFLSRWTSPALAGLFRELPRLPGLTPDPENHSPDLVRISCCLRHRLQTHITWKGWKETNVLQANFSRTTWEKCHTFKWGLGNPVPEEGCHATFRCFLVQDTYIKWLNYSPSM